MKTFVDAARRLVCLPPSHVEADGAAAPGDRSFDPANAASAGLERDLAALAYTHGGDARHLPAPPSGAAGCSGCPLCAQRRLERAARWRRPGGALAAPSAPAARVRAAADGVEAADQPPAPVSPAAAGPAAGTTPPTASLCRRCSRRESRRSSTSSSGTGAAGRLKALLDALRLSPRQSGAAAAAADAAAAPAPAKPGLMSRACSRLRRLAPRRASSGSNDVRRWPSPPESPPAGSGARRAAAEAPAPAPSPEPALEDEPLSEATPLPGEALPEAATVEAVVSEAASMLADQPRWDRNHHQQQQQPDQQRRQSPPGPTPRALRTLRGTLLRAMQRVGSGSSSSSSSSSSSDVSRRLRLTASFAAIAGSMARGRRERVSGGDQGANAQVAVPAATRSPATPLARRPAARSLPLVPSASAPRQAPYDQEQQLLPLPLPPADTRQRAPAPLAFAALRAALHGALLPRGGEAERDASSDVARTLRPAASFVVMARSMARLRSRRRGDQGA